MTSIQENTCKTNSEFRVLGLMFVREEPVRSKKGWDIRRCRKYVSQLTNHQSVGSFINPA